MNSVLFQFVSSRISFKNITIIDVIIYIIDIKKFILILNSITLTFDKRKACYVLNLNLHDYIFAITLFEINTYDIFLNDLLQYQKRKKYF